MKRFGTDEQKEKHTINWLFTTKIIDVNLFVFNVKFGTALFPFGNNENIYFNLSDIKNSKYLIGQIFGLEHVKEKRWFQFLLY